MTRAPPGQRRGLRTALACAALLTSTPALADAPVARLFMGFHGGQVVLERYPLPTLEAPHTELCALVVMVDAQGLARADSTDCDQALAKAVASQLPAWQFRDLQLPEGASELELLVGLSTHRWDPQDTTLHIYDWSRGLDPEPMGAPAPASAPTLGPTLEGALAVLDHERQAFRAVNYTGGAEHDMREVMEHKMLEMKALEDHTAPLISKFGTVEARSATMFLTADDGLTWLAMLAQSPPPVDEPRGEAGADGVWHDVYEDPVLREYIDGQVRKLTDRCLAVATEDHQWTVWQDRTLALLEEHFPDEAPPTRPSWAPPLEVEPTAD
jgi:hypothetical protein